MAAKQLLLLIRNVRELWRVCAIKRRSGVPTKLRLTMWLLVSLKFCLKFWPEKMQTIYYYGGEEGKLGADRVTDGVLQQDVTPADSRLPL